jgi:signal transduction histidine kinase
MPTSTGAARQPPVAHAGEAVPILLVDDQPANLDALEASLTTSGCRFVLARTADEALMALLDQDFAAIVLDVMMPGMSGFELATMIKRRERTQQVPLLFLTARMLDQQDELRGYAVGAVDYLTKPLDPQILRAKLAVFIDLYRKRRALTRINVELQRQISERQRMAEDLRRAKDELESRVSERTAAIAESSRRKDEFLAMLGHELRTPLSALRTAAEALRLKTPQGSEIEPLQGVFERQVRQLSRLTDDLLDMSRLTRGKLTLQRRRIELAEVIHAAVESARPQIEKRQHTLDVDLPTAAVLLDGDLVRLAQILSNLLDNAAKYTDPGGRIRLSAAVSAGVVSVKVEDTGVGIEPDLLPRVFDLFMQGGKYQQEREGGLGLGLALARRIAELHGGTVTGYSAGRGRGAEFVLYLPIPADTRDSSSPSTSGQANTRHAPPPVGQRVLIVEDNADAASVLEIMLKEWGQETRTAQDGIEALEAAAAFQPHFILLDIGLPKLHGYEVARRLRQQPWARDTVVIAVTGWGLEKDRQSEVAGIDHRLLKPVDPGALRDLLAKRA